ncbi:MAG: 30S ribosomal protein S20 [Candidatus Yanofskybacteria bacterium GW2011_GWD2_39_48]|uniref:Small ribosomal subunit protein bS20 n=1 Tax=Candidatus Yanofskybacteria bacterium GW2011_GWD2_39_48 TaxID=1619031 RepID=A0A0G0PD06_9BACT|nr:MAG: 30S ribosomal protein S20 [Candidatus Yanofskybacteria bacterium GW2011_GWD2_39_48]
MPITESARKALRQTKKRRAKNLQRQNDYKIAVKKLAKLSKTDKKAEISKALAIAYKTLDKAAKVGVIKKNKAARLKSKAAKLVK